MEKKKLKLTISGSSKKTINNIELAKSKSKNSVVIEKKNSRFVSRILIQKIIIKKIHLIDQKLTSYLEILLFLNHLELMILKKENLRNKEQQKD